MILQVFVLTDANLDVQIIVGDYCHKNDIKFINANTKGLFGQANLLLFLVNFTLFLFNRQIFCDFGDEFEVLDTNGENPITQIVTGISQDEYGVVFMGTESRHGFEDDQYVVFQDVKGMTDVNGQIFQIKVTSKF